MYKTCLLLLVLFLGGCAASTECFVKVGDETYPPKPEDYEVLVFAEQELPQEEYIVIGMVYAVTPPQLGAMHDEEILDLLKEEARKHGADAIVGVTIGESRGSYDVDYQTRAPDHKLGEAKAIVFK